MTAINVPKGAKPPLQVNRWARNGQYPDITLQTQLAELVNQSCAYRTKEVFRSPGQLNPLASLGAGQRDRWRFAFHTGPFTTQIYCKFVLAIQDHGTAMDAYARLRIQDSLLATTGDAIFHYGSSGGGTTEVPANWGMGTDFVSVLPDTDYYGTFSDFDSARLVAAVVYEVAYDPDAAYGYLPQDAAVGGPIVETHRLGVLTNARNMWRRGGAQVSNWTVDANSILTSSAVNTNVVDQTSTANTAASPGVSLDMTGKARLSQTTGIPCMFKAFGIRSFGSPNDPSVSLIASDGSTIVTLTGFDPTTAGWMSVAFNMPRGVGKYDLQFSSKNGTPFNLYAASIYEYEP